jgi:hypothetical protein
MKITTIIPQNWLINPEGKLEWVQIGYSPSDTTWQDNIISKLEELSKKTK